MGDYEERPHLNIRLVNKALSVYGLHESDMGKLNKTVDYMLDLHRPKENDENWAWCGAFIAYLIDELSIPCPSSLSARFYLKVGVTVLNPKMGDLVIFWRGEKEGWKGHVGLFIRETADLIFCLGGNQNNSVNISSYSKEQLLGYRRL